MSAFRIALFMLLGWNSVSATAAERANPVTLPAGAVDQLRGYCKWEFSGGRLVVLGNSEQSFGLSSSSTGSGFRSEFELRSERGAVTVSMRRLSREGKFHLAAGPDGTLSFEFNPPESRPNSASQPSQPLGFAFHQASSGRVTYRYQTPDGERRLAADGLWDLAVVDPQAVDERLVPVLRGLVPSLDLSAGVSEIRSALALAAVGLGESNVNEWQQLVAKLDGERFREREDAQISLIAGGLPAAVYLAGLDQRRLNAEQRARAEQAAGDALASLPPSNPLRSAPNLLQHPGAWVSALEVEKPEQRQAVALHVARLLGEPIDFDAAADGETRQQQIAALRARLAQGEAASN